MLHVRRFETTFRTRGRDRTAAGPRLGRLVHRLLEHDLPAALLQAGIDDRAVICIRRLELVLDADLRNADAAIGRAWARDIAAALRASAEREQAVPSGGAQFLVVRYPSRRAALLDMLAASAAGDRARAWAWRQLGLWNDARGDASNWLDALLAEPQAVPALLRALDSAGAAAIFQSLPAEAWPLLAARALSGFGLPSGLVDPPAAPLPVPPALLGVASTAVRAWSAPVVRQLGAAGRGAPLVARAVAILILLGAEPAALARAAAAPALIAAVVRVLASAADEDAGEPTTPVVREPAAAPDVIAALTEKDLSPSDSADPVVRLDAAGQRADALDSPSPVGQAAPVEMPSVRTTTPPTDLATISDPVAVPPAPPQADRALGRTAHAGLLFLLHLIDDPARLFPADDPASTTSRPLAWWQHQLALTLLPLDAGDPAALAFAGLAPDIRPPSADAPPPSAGERAAVDDAAGALAEALIARLEPTPLPLAALCTRGGRVIASAGWLDVEMDLQGVSIDVRRAGLDLDLGFIPWLGVVVRFIYV